MLKRILRKPLMLKPISDDKSGNGETGIPLLFVKSCDTTFIKILSKAETCANFLVSSYLYR